MKKSRFTEEQITLALRQVDSGDSRRQDCLGAFEGPSRG
jgi:hypothetical protein